MNDLSQSESMTGTLSNNLRALRKQQGWTQAQLAKHIGGGVTPRTIEAWEQNYRKPRGLTAKAVMQFIDRRLKP